MQTVRITLAMRDETDPSRDLRTISAIRQDLWSRSPLEVSPGSKEHSTRRNQEGYAFFEFATNHPDLVTNVLEQCGYLSKVLIDFDNNPQIVTCEHCGKPVGGRTPNVCPYCGYRDISPCPHCLQEIDREAYLDVAGDILKCPVCNRFVRISFAKSLNEEPAVIVTKAETNQ